MSEAPNADHARLRDKLAFLRDLDPYLDVFGAGHHGYQLEAPISPEALSAFETMLGARLPEDYRAFLLEMGNGGAGPYYGIAPLQVWETEARPLADGPMDGAAYDEWCEHDGPGRAADVRREFVLDGAFYPLQIADQTRRYNLPPGGSHPFDGCVRLADVGCGESVFLVVRGRRAGEVWLDQSQAAWPIRLVASSFLEWYERRLDLGICEALASAVPQALVGGSIASALLAAVEPIVEATWARWRDRAPLPESDEDLDRGKAAAAFAHLRLWQRRRDPGIDERIAPHYVALAFEGPERAIEVIDRAAEPSSDMLSIRARLLRRLGRHAEALAAWDAAIRKAPYDADFPRYKADLQLTLGDRAGAEATILVMAKARRDPEEAAELVVAFAASLEGEDAALFQALAARIGEGSADP